MSSTIFRTFLQIQNTAGTNAKKEILRNNMTPVIRQIFEDTYGPKKYYIKKFVPNCEYGHLFIDIDYDTFHNTLVQLPMAEDVPYWQGSGLTYDFTSISTVHAEIDTGNNTTKEITMSGVLGVAFDHDAAGITNLDRRVTSNYNPKAEFTNYFYKVDCGYFNDLNENAVVFFVQ